MTMRYFKNMYHINITNRTLNTENLKFLNSCIYIKNTYLKYCILITKYSNTNILLDILYINLRIKSFIKNKQEIQ